MDIKNICYVDGKHEITEMGLYWLRLDGDNFHEYDSYDILVTKKELMKLERSIKKEKKHNCEYIELSIIDRLKALVDDEKNLCEEATSVFYQYLVNHLKRYFVLRKIRLGEPVPVYSEWCLLDDDDD